MPQKGQYGFRHSLLAAPSSATSLAAWIRRYLEALAMLGAQPLSLKGYESDLGAFHAWCVERELMRPDEITKPILERWQKHLFYYRKPNGQPLGMGRQGVLLHRVRALFRWLAKHNHIAANPASDLDVPRVPPRSLPEVLTVAEVESLLATFDVTQATGLLGRAMIEVLYSTAIRRAELVGLQLYDIDAGRSVLHVRRGKGGKPRLVPIGERALAWVQKYLDEARPLLAIDAAQSALFVNERGAPVNPPGLADRIGQAKQQAGITKRGACHMFRHTAATLMLEHGADIRYIQEMLGHANVDTTQLYTQVSIDKLKQIHAATHPGAKLKRRDLDIEARIDADAALIEPLASAPPSKPKRKWRKHALGSGDGSAPAA